MSAIFNCSQYAKLNLFNTCVTEHEFYSILGIILTLLMLGLFVYIIYLRFRSEAVNKARNTTSSL